MVVVLIFNEHESILVSLVLVLVRNVATAALCLLLSLSQCAMQPAFDNSLVRGHSKHLNFCEA